MSGTQPRASLNLETTSLSYRDYCGTCLCCSQQNIVVHSKWLQLLTTKCIAEAQTNKWRSTQLQLTSVFQNIHFMLDENEFYVCTFMEDSFNCIQTASLEEFLEIF